MATPRLTRSYNQPHSLHDLYLLINIPIPGTNVLLPKIPCVMSHTNLLHFFRTKSYCCSQYQHIFGSSAWNNTPCKHWKRKKENCCWTLWYLKGKVNNSMMIVMSSFYVIILLCWLVIVRKDQGGILY
jgi:hypothetical protein